MVFDLYLLFSALLAIVLIIFIVTFGLPMFTGAPFAVSSRYKINKLMALLKEVSGGRPDLKAVDLGSGDGRIVIALAQNSFIASGLEVNLFLAWFSRWKIRLAHIQKTASIKRANFWHEDFSQYDVVVLFGVFYIMEKLEKKLLAELKPGAIVACNHFFFPTWQPVKREGDVCLYRR